MRATQNMDKKALERDVEDYSDKIERIKHEIQKGIIGQEEVLNSIIRSIISRGHVLIEGVPGVAKTLTILLLSETIKDAAFQRIQFTPDLLPSDITGVSVYEKKRGFYTQKGPIFANLVIGDEINRTPPKVQSAMLQAMQERQVTIGKETFDLPDPFFILATQNPIETKGIYPLPEAQVDRFITKVLMDYPDKASEKIIIDKNVEVIKIEDYDIKQVVTLDDILAMQKLVRQIYSSREIKEYIVHLVNATRHPDRYNVDGGDYVQWGGSPRATIYLSLASKATALMDGRTYVVPEDVTRVAHEILRHRIILNYEGKAKEIKTDTIIDSILDSVPVL